MPQPRASDVAAFLGLDLSGPDLTLVGVSSIGQPRPGTLSFIGQTTAEARVDLPPHRDLCIISAQVIPISGASSLLLSDHPRRDFALAFAEFFAPDPTREVQETARIAPSALLGPGTSIGHNTVISGGVSLGSNCEIHHNVVIAPSCNLGSNVRVKSGAVIGEKGFGFERGDENRPVEMPHIGGVEIGHSVEIGALSTIASGTIDPTVIGDYVKIDDQVFIAHNVHIGPNTFVIAGAEVSGSIVIGADCWIGPQTCIRDGISIGKGALVGMGAVVTKPVPPGVVVAGNPARVLRER